MSRHYQSLKDQLMNGWNTWNTSSILSHVLLPDGFCINLGLKEYSNGDYLKDILFGRMEKEAERAIPGLHAYDGSYTSVMVEWKGIHIKVETAHSKKGLVILITPVRLPLKTPTLIAEAGILWNKEGYVKRQGDAIGWYSSQNNKQVFFIGSEVYEKNIPTGNPFFAIRLDEAIGISIGEKLDLEALTGIINDQKLKHLEHIETYDHLAHVYEAIQTCIAWDTIYDPQHHRVITPVSRNWNVTHGGYALFCWDNYFVAYMAAMDNKDLAYANAIEITKEKTPNGFVPNCAWGNGFKSYDRSQPPVGSLVIERLYSKYKDKWLLEEVIDDLIDWNNWWYTNRLNGDLLSWGSNPYQPMYSNYWETAGINDIFGGALESGLDNTPMYDGVPFNKSTHLMEMHDVGLNSLYIMDCGKLAEICRFLQRNEEAETFEERAKQFKHNMQELWDEKRGFFYNKLTLEKQFSDRISPTNFYVLLGNVATKKQAERIIDEHYFNENEFYGEWVMPSIARNDAAYKEQEYWRGRIWPPLNFLVYTGMQNYTLDKARKDLVDQSRKLLLHEWLDKGHVHENYNADTGIGCDVNTSDRFYHWGGLLGFISILEGGYF